MTSLKEWIAEDGERVLHELTNLLEYLGVELGNMQSLRRTVDDNAEKAKATKVPVVDSLEPSEEIVYDMPKYPAIMSIEVETCYNAWISISRDYVWIMDRPSRRIDWRNIEDVKAHTKGYSLLDNPRSYKNDSRDYLVPLIDALIKDLLLL